MPASSVTVRVPASTSNLGPGFDCLGLALGLYNELTVTLFPGKGPVSMEITGEGAERLPVDERNLIVRAARLALPKNATDRRLVFSAVNRIPLGRGLGSSATAVISGLCAANSLFQPSVLKSEDILRLAVKLEGHPDNAAASLYGGLVVSSLESGGPRIWKLNPHKKLTAVVCIPDFELLTKSARAVLPQKVSRQDAVFNASRALLLASVLESGRWERIGTAMEDRIHQPYRARLVPGLLDVIASVRKNDSWGAALSGAGSSVVALGPGGPRAAEIGRGMRKAFARRGIKSRILILPCDRRGTVVTPCAGAHGAWRDWELLERQA